MPTFTSHEETQLHLPRDAAPHPGAEQPVGPVLGRPVRTRQTLCSAQQCHPGTSLERQEARPQAGLCGTFVAFSLKVARIARSPSVCQQVGGTDREGTGC